MSSKTLIICTLTIVLAGCAGVSVVTVKESDAQNQCIKASLRSICDEKATGFRYYEPAPFLFVHSDGAGGIAAEVVWLPDTTKKMSISPYAYLASNKTTLTFANGMLTEASTAVDETIIPNAVLSAIVTAGVKAIAGSEGSQVPVPYLFKISFDPHTGDAKLTGGFPTLADKATPVVIHVTIADTGAAK